MTLSVASQSLVHPSPRRTQLAAARWPAFFIAMASVLAAIVAVGFAPSFYLRPYLQAVPPAAARAALPTHVYVHGIVLTCWFVLFLAQTILVASRRVRLHRVLGAVGAGLAVGLATTCTAVGFSAFGPAFVKALAASAA